MDECTFSVCYRMMLHLFMLVLGTLINVAWLAESHSLEYKLEEFAKSPGIYYKNLGKAVLYGTAWKTVVYLPLETVTNQLVTTDSYVEYVNQLCSKVHLRSWTACNHLDELTSTKLCQVQESERLIASTAGRRDEESTKKRGLFDFVGKVSMILFRTTDGDDAQYYNDQTEHFVETITKQLLDLFCTNHRHVNRLVQEWTTPGH